MAERTLSSEIEPLFDEMAHQFADAIEKANKFHEELDAQLPMLTDRIFTMAEEELLSRVLTNSIRFAKASFLTRWYWKRKVEKLLSAFEETHKAFEEWRMENANH